MARLFLALLGSALAVVLGVALIAGPTAGVPAPAASAHAQADIPARLQPVYEQAAARCDGLPWQVLAAIGWVESRHGQGRVDPNTGWAYPPIIGPAIDGRPGFAAIPDPTQPDGWAHAVGPMQFLTTTFTHWAVLAPGRPARAAPSPHNAWDAIHTAARYLCGGDDRIDNLAAAIRRYNHSDAYVHQVLTKASEYTRR